MRKAGQVWKNMPKAKGGEQYHEIGGLTTKPPINEIPTLEVLDITKNEVFRWLLFESLPQEVLNAYIDEATAGGYELTAGALVKIAKQIRDAVEMALRKQNPLSPRHWPGLSVVQKVLAQMRKREKLAFSERHKLDTPWSIGCTSEYDISPEALPPVIEIYRRWLKQNKPDFTIRLYSFRMTYGFASRDRSQNIAVDPRVLFQTTRVIVQLKDSTGALMDTVTVQYYSGGWKDFGATSGGQVYKELLPAAYTFRMTYGFASQDKSQNIASDPIVFFQTGQVHSDSGSCYQYYAGGWRGFMQDMQLLPLVYTFRFNDGTPSTLYTIITDSVTHIH